MKALVISFGLFFATYLVNLLHLSTLAPPDTSRLKVSSNTPAAVFLPKSDLGIHQLIVHGSPYERGLASGGLTQEYLRTQEKLLEKEFLHFFPNIVLRQAFIFVAMRWFWGVDKYIQNWAAEELYGTSKFATNELNYLLDPYTRKFAYHGIHEVGQFFVDVQREDLGCSFFAVPTESSWIIGRNFDFEVGRYFDEEKLMRWAFPDKGNAYLSVAWSGMLGSITGINEKKVYISFNAAGSRDFRRYGVPSTLLVTDALLNADTAEEAVEMIKSAEVFISDIYTVADGKTGRLYKIEKTPRRAVVRMIEEPIMIANHFTEKPLVDDSINQFRMRELTSAYRQERGNQLLKTVPPKADSDELELAVLGFLRDKNDDSGAPLHLGSRKAIDALIASHSVIYNAKDSQFFVSQGPAVAGPFIGFDLNESFRLKTPIYTKTLPRDPSISDKQFYAVKESLKLVSESETLTRKQECRKAKLLLDEAKKQFSDHINFDIAMGKYFECIGEPRLARSMWKKALKRKPAYAQQEQFLKSRM